MWHDVEKGKWQKAPAVPKGVSWLEASTLPAVALPWPSGVVGVPIPPGVVVIDLDEYKPDFDMAAITAAIGVLPWDAARIQKTVSGGHHYAFQAPSGWEVRLGDSIENVAGLDTRTARTDDSQGGFICTGEGYTPLFGGAGVLAMTEGMRSCLPVLPASARNILEKKTRAAPTPTATTPTDTDTATVLGALACVSPAGARDGWRDIGMALKSWPEPAPADDARFEVWDRWSAGEYTGGGCPENYEPNGMQGQWDKFDAKKEGGINLGTLFHRALEGGWTRPASFDTSAAFGAGAAPEDQYAALLKRIDESGIDPDAFEGLKGDIGALNGSPIQTAKLTAKLSGYLKGEGYLTPDVSRQLKKLTNSQTQAPRAAGEYGKNHTENAVLYMERHHPGGMIKRSDQVWYAYTGKAWAELCDDDVKHTVAADLAPSFPQLGVSKGTYGILEQLCHSRGKTIGDVDPGLVLYQNGVLNLHTGALLPHSPDYFTTNILPYDFTPGAQCPQWLKFMGEVFEGDQERIDLLQEWFGYMITTSYAHHKILMMIGPPRCGKGTIGRMLQHIVGDQNYTGGSLIDFKNPAFLDSLTAKTVLFSGDTAKRVHPSVRDVVTEQLKKISGNDAVTFDRKYKSVLTRTLPTRITLAANQKPHLFDDSGALAGRMLFLPFDVTFAGREDIGLNDRLALEVEGVAIWALQGMARLNTAGRFTEPAAALIEREDMEALCSPLKDFIDDMCTFGEGRTAGADLAEAYQAWCTKNAVEHPLGAQNFAETFRDATRGRCKRGVYRFDGKSTRGYEGLTLQGAPCPPAATTTGGAFAPTIIEGGKK
jgi:P4 family phage/plasmid primase-like protien